MTSGIDCEDKENEEDYLSDRRIRVLVTEGRGAVSTYKNSFIRLWWVVTMKVTRVTLLTRPAGVSTEGLSPGWTTHRPLGLLTPPSPKVKRKPGCFNLFY